MNDSKLDNCLKGNNFGVIMVAAYHLWQPNSWKFLDKFDQLGNTLVEESANLLQVDYLLWGAAKQCDVLKELRQAKSPAEFSGTFGVRPMIR